MRNLLLTILLFVIILPALGQPRPARPNIVVTKSDPIVVQIDSQFTILPTLIIDTAKIELYEILRKKPDSHSHDSLLLRLTLKSP